MAKRSNQTRELILSTALELFRSEGFSKTSMREIATKAGLATGAAYYYFKSKDEIVMHFYRQLAAEFDETCRTVADETEDFAERLQRMMNYRFKQLEPYADSLPVLVRNAVDPSSPLSAFGKDTVALRVEAVRSFETLLRGSNLKVPGQVRAQLPSMLWVWHMGILYFWLIDESPNKKDTHEVIAKSLTMMTELMRTFVIPGVADMIQPLLDISNIINIAPHNLVSKQTERSN